MPAKQKVSMRKFKPFIPLLAILFAFFIITTTIDYQSFWIDEVHAFDFINHPFAETVDLIIDPQNNGPLYFVLLWVWHRLVGPSDLAIRFFSDLCMILTVALMWRLAKVWFNERIANIAICIMVAAPFTIWFGQEAKMYAFHMMLATSSTLLITLALKKNRWSWWLAYGICINLLGYSHFFGALTIAAQGILVLLSVYRNWKLLRSYLITMVIISLPYIPVVLYVLQLAPSYESQDNSKGFVLFRHVIQELVSEYTLRVPRTYVSYIWPLVIVTLTLVLIGWVFGLRESRKNHKPGINTSLWLIGLMVLPVAIYYVGSFIIPVFSARYLSAIYPLFIISLALCVSAGRKLFRPLGALLLIGMLLFLARGNYKIYTDPGLQRSDWRLVADYLDTHAGPNDVIVVYADYLHRAVLRYYDGDVPVIRFKADPYEPQAFYQDQQALGYERMWLVLHQDQAMAPQNRLKEVAGILFPNIAGVYPNMGNIALLGYSMDWEFASVPEGTLSVKDGMFENGVSLIGYTVDYTSLPPNDNLLHPPSNWIHVTTYWQRTGEINSDAFTPYVHLVGVDGGVWGADLQRVPTAWHRFPASGWNSDSVYEIHYDVNLNPVTPAGKYDLVLGINTDGESSTPIKTVNNATMVLLTDIQITD